MSGDHDADEIRNRRSRETGERFMRLLPRIEAMFVAIDGEGAAGDQTERDAKAKEHFDLGNRAEDAIGRLETKVREVGDLPDQLRAQIEEGRSLVDGLKASVADVEKLRADLAERLKNAAPPAAPNQPAERQPGTTGTGGQDGPTDHVDPEQIARENAETAEDVRRRTERPEPSGSVEQARVQALPDGPKVDAAASNAAAQAS